MVGKFISDIYIFRLFVSFVSKLGWKFCFYFKNRQSLLGHLFLIIFGNLWIILVLALEIYAVFHLVKFSFTFFDNFFFNYRLEASSRISTAETLYERYFVSEETKAARAAAEEAARAAAEEAKRIEDERLAEEKRIKEEKEYEEYLKTDRTRRKFLVGFVLVLFIIERISRLGPPPK